MTKATKSARRTRRYVHTAAYFKAPDLHYDAMSDAEYESVGGSNRMRTEAEVQAIAREFRCSDPAKMAALMARLEQAAIYAAGFAADDPEDAAEFTCSFVWDGKKAEGPLVWCIDLLRHILNPPPLVLPAPCAMCGRI